MEIFRRPGQASNLYRSWSPTSRRSAESIAAEWRPGGVLRFDGTIDKRGTRSTEIGVRIDLRDIGELATVALRDTAKRMESLEAENRNLRGAIGKLRRLVEAGTRVDIEQLRKVIGDLA